MNIAINVLGIVLFLGAFFGFGVLFVRWYDEWKQRKRERSEFWMVDIEKIEKEKQRINVINDIHEANKENYRKYEERIKELELELASYVILSKGIEVSSDSSLKIVSDSIKDI